MLLYAAEFVHLDLSLCDLEPVNLYLWALESSSVTSQTAPDDL